MQIPIAIWLKTLIEAGWICSNAGRGKWAMGKCDITGFEFLGKWQPLGVTPTWDVISSPGVKSRRVRVKPNNAKFNFYYYT